MKVFTLCPIIVYESGIEAGGPGSRDIVKK